MKHQKIKIKETTLFVYKSAKERSRNTNTEPTTMTVATTILSGLNFNK